MGSLPGHHTYALTGLQTGHHTRSGCISRPYRGLQRFLPSVAAMTVALTGSLVAQP
jgi:hypothetical protein